MNYLEFMAKAKKEALNFGFVGIFQQKKQTKNGSNVLKLERGTWFLFVCVSVVTLDELYSYDWRVLSLVFLFFFFNTEVVFLSLLRPTFPSCTFFLQQPL